MSRKKISDEIELLAEAIFINRSSTCSINNYTHRKGNEAIIKNCFELAELFVKIKQERKQQDEREENK